MPLQIVVTVSDSGEVSASSIPPMPLPTVLGWLRLGEAALIAQSTESASKRVQPASSLPPGLTNLGAH